MIYESPVMEVIILDENSVRTGMEPSTSGTGGVIDPNDPNWTAPFSVE